MNKVFNRVQMSHDLSSDYESKKRGKVQRCAGYRFFKTMRFLYKKLVDDLLQISPVFRFVKVLGLVEVLSAVIICESWAAEIPTGGVSGTCNNAGTCLWNLDENGKMIISAAEGAKEVKMDNYSCVGSPICSSQTGNRPWENYLKQIEHVVVSNNIINIGSDSFQNATALKTVTGMKDVKTISTDAFLHTTSLSSIETPNVEAIGGEAFVSTSLSSIDLPNILQIGGDVFRNARNLAYIGLPKKNVSIHYGAFINTNLANCSNENRAACGNCGNGYVMSGLGCVSDCGAGYLGKEGRCIDSSNGCGAGYRQFENFCNRIQYTPAEAAEVLRDDNTNEVTITFRK